MEYTISNDSAGRMATITGRVTFKEQATFRELINTLFNETSASYVLNLGGVDHIDSAGLGMLLIARKHAQAKSADVILRHPPEGVRMTLDLAKFNELFTIEG